MVWLNDACEDTFSAMLSFNPTSRRIRQFDKKKGVYDNALVGSGMVID